MLSIPIPLGISIAPAAGRFDHEGVARFEIGAAGGAQHFDPAVGAFDPVAPRYGIVAAREARRGYLAAVGEDVRGHGLAEADAAGVAVKHARNFAKRIVYGYFLRDMSVASIALLFGAPLLAFGVVFGAWHWIALAGTGRVASTGTVMLAALPVIVGLQFLLAFLAYDIANVPRRPVSRK